jgi:hypothetical protein
VVPPVNAARRKGSLDPLLQRCALFQAAEVVPTEDADRSLETSRHLRPVRSDDGPVVWEDEGDRDRRIGIRSEAGAGSVSRPRVRPDKLTPGGDRPDPAHRGRCLPKHRGPARLLGPRPVPPPAADVGPPGTAGVRPGRFRLGDIGRRFGRPGPPAGFASGLGRPDRGPGWQPPPVGARSRRIRSSSRPSGRPSADPARGGLGGSESGTIRPAAAPGPASRRTGGSGPRGGSERVFLPSRWGRREGTSP